MSRVELVLEYFSTQPNTSYGSSKKPIQSSPKGPDMLGWAGHHVEAILSMPNKKILAFIQLFVHVIQRINKIYIKFKFHQN